MQNTDRGFRLLSRTPFQLRLLLINLLCARFSKKPATADKSNPG